MLQPCREYRFPSCTFLVQSDICATGGISRPSFFRLLRLREDSIRSGEISLRIQLEPTDDCPENVFHIFYETRRLLDTSGRQLHVPNTGVSCIVFPSCHEDDGDVDCRE